MCVVRNSRLFLSVILFAFHILSIISSHSVVGSCMGCVELDEITFDKIIPHFKFSLVKFDIAFPYGPKHETYGDFAKNYGQKIDDLLVSLVGVKDYGEKENRVLAQRYNVNEKAYPEIVLFLNNNTQKYVKYPLDWTLSIDNLKRFVSEHTNIYIPLEGCIEEFDKLSLEFAQGTVDEQKELLTRAQEKAEKVTDDFKERANIYIRLMEKIIEKNNGGQFILDERKRVEKLLKEKLSDNKKKLLVQRRNILQSFQINQDKDEL